MFGLSDHTNAVLTEPAYTTLLLELILNFVSGPFPFYYIHPTTIHKLNQWPTKKGLNSVPDTQNQWNFHKILIDEDGNLAGTLSSTLSIEILNIFLSTFVPNFLQC